MSTSAHPECTVEFEDLDLFRLVVGQQDENLRVLERMTGLACHRRGNQITLEGEQGEVRFGRRVLDQLSVVARAGVPLYSADVERAIRMANADPKADIAGLLSQPLYVSRAGKRVRPRSLAQQQYVQAIEEHDVVFGVGPAGTGKTFLAMVMAVKALLEKRVRRIVLCRPAVEAGEKLGFLPGDLEEKVDPYLRPLQDALHDLVEGARLDRMMEQGQVEVAPLAFMRGRTLNDAFVIFDEAQNATVEQMKMFLTRLGISSKAVITGDITQIDLAPGRTCGLTHAHQVLHGIEDIAFHRFTDADVVRHPLVQAIVRAYEREARELDRG